MSDDKEVISVETALKWIGDGEEIHVFMNHGGMLIGAVGSRKEILELLNTAKLIEIGGNMCQRMKHPLVAWDKDGKPRFIQAERPRGSEVVRKNRTIRKRKR